MKYDKPREEQSGKQEAKLLKAAAVVAGGVLFHKKGGTKYLSKAIGDVSHTMSKVKNDIKLIGRKNLTAEKTNELFKKHISNSDSTWKIKRAKTQKLNRNSGLFKELNNLDNLSETLYEYARNDKDYELKRHAFESLGNKFKGTKEANEELLKELYTLTDRALSRQSEFFEIGDTPGTYNPVMKKFKAMTKGNKLEGKEEEVAGVLTNALEHAKEIKDKTKVMSNAAKKDARNLYEDHIKEKYKIKKTSGDRAASLEDVFNAIQEKKLEVSEFEEETKKFLDDIQARMDKDPKIKNLAVDPKTYRMDENDQFYSLDDLRKTAEKAEEGFSETILGKIFATKNIIEGRKAPDMFHFSAGMYEPGIAKALGGKDILRENVTYIGGKFYKETELGLKHLEALDGRTFISGKAGTMFTYLDRLAGNAAQKNQDNAFLNLLDINTKGGEFFKERLSMFTKFSETDNDWGRNISKRLSKDYTPDKIVYKESVRDMYDDLILLSRMYNENTKPAAIETIESLKNVLSDDSVKVLNSLNSEDPLVELKGLELINKDLRTIINKVSSDENLKGTMTRATKNRVIKYDEMLEREVLKEALFQDMKTNGNTISGYSITLEKIRKSGLTPIEDNNVRDIMNWGIIQHKGRAFSKDIYSPKDILLKTEAYNNMSHMMFGKNENLQEQAFLKEFKDSVINFTKENTSLLDTLEINNNNQLGYDRPQWMTVKKSTSVLDIIESLNNKTKSLDSTVESFVKQFVAGRDNIDEVTGLTMLPFHMVNRLTTPLESFGLGFSNASTGSTVDLVKSIAMKRILPVAAIMYGASYLNYEAENLTGTSFTEAYQNAKANFGVGVRTILSPFDSYLERQRDFNPIANYLLGDHKDKDEYLDYLEYGYDPVRKGRFWSFGSASEFRGGKISYWEPNKLRQAHSNYRDIAIYGSSEEKWSHSLIPTLRHPFSTIKYLMNPYWLEEKHYEDRPYPVSGKMFTEGTPWGAILNPTIGQMIKPMKRMHQEHLQGTGLDVRKIIERKNTETKEKAQENRMIRIDESGFTPMMFSPNSMINENEAMYNIKFGGGKILSAGFEGQQYVETLPHISEAAVADVSKGEPIVSTSLQYGIGRLSDPNSGVDPMGNALLSGVAAMLTSGAVQGKQAIKMIESVNSEIKFRGESGPKGEWVERARMQSNPSYAHTQEMKLDHVDDMIAFNTKKEFVHDLMYSTKQLSGIYGFLFDQVTPDKKGYRLESAGQMSSFSRVFWDESVGGLGGNLMEITRRFFPHKDRSIEDINPIRNTMESWLPERFQTGDPYTKVTKGEARLPGAGYEALNKLRPDKYGRYGALDRMKILGDIAPLSEEYKIWKKIAKAEYTDANGKKEIAQIEERVREQTKEHDFYNYKFLGQDMEDRTAIIGEVSNSGKFKIIGSDQTFSMAGIKPLKDEETGSYVHNYLKAGMKVRLSYDSNEYNNKDAEGNISAVVYSNGENINASMWEDGTAKEKERKENLADERFKLTEMNSITAPIWEAIGHAPIPFIHNKFLRINSSLETYKHEQVYGTPYSTWDHPIKGFVKPAFQEAMASSLTHQAIGVGALMFSEYARDKGKSLSTAADLIYGMSSPGAFAGGMLAALPKMDINIFKGVSDNVRTGAKIGTAVTLAGFALNNTQNPLLSMGNFAAAGFALQSQFKFKGQSKITASLIGAGVGLAISGLNPESSIFNLSKKWIPEDTEKKWEIEEYFDRLEYIKYTNLYHKAADKAKRKEGVDIERIINKFERNKEENEKTIAKLEKQKEDAEKILDENARKKLIASIDYKINKLLTPIQYLQAGEYTKSAIAYKKAADTTIYGLSNDATTADILRALPKYDRDFFLDFANEKDPKKRKKILQYVSPYKAKALKLMWGEEVDEPESNENFFNNHNLPNLFWSGWQPQVDLDHVKMKTIENEGMLLSDFGMYDSNMSEPAVQASPEIRNIHKTSPQLAMQANLTSLMNGVGFSNVNVTVEPTSEPGVKMIADISRVATYNISNKVNSVLNKLLL